MRNVGGEFTPDALVQTLASVLDFQQRLIEEAGGIVAQFVGGCVTAYWPSSDLDSTLAAVAATAQRMVHEKVQIGGLDYRLVVRFCASELLGAFFGPPTSVRFQVIGKARSRVESLPKGVPGQDCVFTDHATFQAMPEVIRAEFAPASSSVYLMKLMK